MRIPFPSISLAAKCRILFGAAVLLIITAALLVPWLRMIDLVHAKNFETSRQIATIAARRCTMLPGDWKSRQQALNDWWARESALYGLPGDPPRLIPVIDPLRPKAPLGSDEYIEFCVTRLAEGVGLQEAPPRVERSRTGTYMYRTVIPIRAQGEQYPAGTLLAVVAASYVAPKAPLDQVENLGLMIMAGALSGLLAVLVFYIITQRLILSPVRELRGVADQVSAGKHDVRSDIATGDEFEDLARAFNSMLTHLEQQQDELRTINRSLDTRVGELAERNIALFEADRVKTQFVANVSHELRTPLTSIIGFAELLREGPADPERAQRYVQNIVDSARMLLSIINDLLDLAKIEAGKFLLHRGPVNLREMVENLLDFMQPLADKNKLALTGTVADDVPVIHSDSGRIQQILYNLLSNALKFSRPGGRVTLTVLREDDDRVRLTVQDDGIGIPAAQLPHIFDKFWQLDGSKTRQHSGTGLGLAITRELVQVLGGAISVTSVEEHGSTFIVTLPATAPETMDLSRTALND